MRKRILIALLGVACYQFALAQTPPSSPPSGSGATSQEPQPGTTPPIQTIRGHRPPREAIAACKQKAKGDACSFVNHAGNTINGACVTPRNALAPTPSDAAPPPPMLACRAPRGAGGGHPPPAAS